MSETGQLDEKIAHEELVALAENIFWKRSKCKKRNRKRSSKEKERDTKWTQDKTKIRIITIKLNGEENFYSLLQK